MCGGFFCFCFEVWLWWWRWTFNWISKEKKKRERETARHVWLIVIHILLISFSFFFFFVISSARAPSFTLILFEYHAHFLFYFIFLFHCKIANSLEMIYVFLLRPIWWDRQKKNLFLFLSTLPLWFVLRHREFVTTPPRKRVDFYFLFSVISLVEFCGLQLVSGLKCSDVWDIMWDVISFF